MKRSLVRATILAGGLLAAGAAAADAQVSAGIQLSWHWSESGWNHGPVVDGYVHYTDAPRYAVVTHEPVRVRPAPRFRVPPGHMPPAGMCRVWYMGRPPGHQPRPTSCARAFRSVRGPGAIVLHTPHKNDRRWKERGDWWDDDRRWQRGDRDWDDDDRRGRGNGRGRGGS